MRVLPELDGQAARRDVLRKLHEKINVYRKRSAFVRQRTEAVV